MGRALPWSLSNADRGVTSDQRRRWRAGRRARVRRLSRHSRAVRQLHALLMPSRQLRGGLPAHGTRRSNDVGFLRIRHPQAPCERFAPWVTPGPRITRFRLAADLGRMGLDTHRVSNKVSKITSRHLVPLDRAFPAHALLHESELARTDPDPQLLHRSMRYDIGLPSPVI